MTMTMLMVMAGTMPWGGIFALLNTKLGWIGIGIQLLGLIGVLVLGFTGNWGI